MRAQWMGWIAAAWMGLMTSVASGQSLLEQLEQKVRDGLELAAPKDSKSQAPDTGQAASSEQLPAPAPKKDPPPPPAATATPGARSSSSILEPPAATDSRVLRETADTPTSEPRIYLGLEAESLAGGGIGARIVGITENSPAWRAGFKVNDVILAIDGYAIANLDSMVERLTPRRPGETIKVLVLRGGRNMELTAVLQDAAIAERIQNGGAGPVHPDSGLAWLGVAVADLSTAFRNQFGLRVSRAAAVTNVSKGSPAEQVNILPGDAIVSVDGQTIQSARDLLDWTASQRPGDRVTVTVMRGARTIAFDVTLGVDPKFVPLPPRKPVVGNPLPPAQPTGDLTLGDYADTAVGKVIAENTVPPPPGAELSELEQLREELRLTREQIGALERRIAELESQQKQTPQ